MKFRTLSLLCLGLAITLAGASPAAQDEDLGALARAEREKREKEHKKPAKTMTNDDVSTAPSTSPPATSTGIPGQALESASKQERIKYIVVAALSIAVQEDIDRDVKVEGEPPEDVSKRAAASAAAIEVSRKEIEKLKTMPPPLTDAEIPSAGGSLSEKAARAFALMSARERDEGQQRMEEGIQTGQIVMGSNECAHPLDSQIKYRCLYTARLIEIQRSFIELLRNVPPMPKEDPNPAIMAMNHAQAVGSLRTLNMAEVTYASMYGHGYSQTLDQLGPSKDSKPSDAHASMIDAALATGKKSGYSFTYVPHPGATSGSVNSYELYADPIQHGVDGTVHYFTDQTYVLHKTNDDRQATARDEKL